MHPSMTLSNVPPDCSELANTHGWSGSAGSVQRGWCLEFLSAEERWPAERIGNQALREPAAATEMGAKPWAAWPVSAMDVETVWTLGACLVTAGGSWREFQPLPLSNGKRTLAGKRLMAVRGTSRKWRYLRPSSAKISKSDMHWTVGPGRPPVARASTRW